jgi:CRISPR-associated protein Cmr2
MKTHLHFTFGPVQGFVAQARRTRDLYAGSFLLSHLALAAMKAAEDAGGEIILPKYETLKTMADSPHAVAPNRFIAGFSDANANAAAEASAKAAVKALKTEWERIADFIWEKYLAAAVAELKNENTPVIWKRQIENFWEISWAVGTEKETDLLDRRKNWRTLTATPEEGDHCTLMSQYQELSGHIRNPFDKRQQTFWEKIHKHPGIKYSLDLAPDERLCAIAFVKRFFPNNASAILGRDLDMESWPSTVSIAAIPWQKTVRKKIEKGDSELGEIAREYASLLLGENAATVSSARRIRSLENFTSAGNFYKLSGNFLNRTTLENKQGTPLNEDRTGSDGKQRRKYLDALKALEVASGDRAGNFYALLLMDGDSMGKLIRDHSPGEVSAALTEFSKAAPAVIENHDGICVYAGGDDLLAMLPLDSALDAVLEVRKRYLESFPNNWGKDSATISAGIVFAHYRCPFSQVMAHAHHMLDKVAKDGAGRDAVALEVFKSSGITCRWVGKFAHFTETHGGSGAHCFAPLIAAFKETEGSSLSSKLLYNLRARYEEIIEDINSRAPENLLPEIENLQKLFVAEAIHGRLDRDPVIAQRQRNDATALIQKLLHICLQSDDAEPPRPKFKLSLDGARLIKFLALDGKEGAE